MRRAVLFFPVGAVLRLGILRQRFFRLAKAGGDTAQRTIRTDMAVPAHSVIGRHRPALRLLPAAKIAVNVTRGLIIAFPCSCAVHVFPVGSGEAFNGVV